MAKGFFLETFFATFVIRVLKEWMMKNVYIKDILDPTKVGTSVLVMGWVKSIRRHKSVTFIDVTDSTGQVQVVFDHLQIAFDTFKLLQLLTRETAVAINGTLNSGTRHLEVEGSTLSVVGNIAEDFSPPPRGDEYDPFSPLIADHMLKNRDLYLRNPKIMALMKYRSLVLEAARAWFKEHNVLEITAPVLTKLPLYEDGTVIKLQVHDQDLFLTQCVGFYLEAAAMAHENVYNIGPSFRREESRSLRHLMEYWHIKAEMCWMNLEEGMETVESFISYMTDYCIARQDTVTAWYGSPQQETGKAPFPRITYREAIALLNTRGFSLPFGQSLGHDEEVELSNYANGPIWIVGVPRSVEPFPYVIDPHDNLLTRTADLIASNGNGELLGVAEKSYDINELEIRMKEKGKWGKPEYDWVVRQRRMGAVPRIGFGIGAERFIRWMLGIRHVRDVIPFPRTFNRAVYP